MDVSIFHIIIISSDEEVKTNQESKGGNIQ